MHVPSRTYQELIEDNSLLKQRIQELEKAEAICKQVEEALLESENKFKSLVEQARAAIYLIQDGVFKYVNYEFARMFGYTVEECLNDMSFISLVYAEDVANVKEQVGKRIVGEVGFVHYTFRGVKKNGQIFDVEIYGAASEHKGSPAATGTLLDITERKRTEDALFESESKFKSLIDQARAAICLIQDGVFKYVNPRFAQMFGYTVEECLNDMPFKTIAYAEDLTEVEEQVGKRIRGEVEFVQYTFRGVKKNGQIFNVESYGSASIHKGRPSSTATLLDITERKWMEEALLESESKFKSLVEQARAAIYLIQDGVFKYVNHEFARMFGYTVEECLDMPFKNLVYVEDMAKVAEQVGKRIVGEVGFVHYTFRGVKKNGQIFDVEIYGSASVHKGRPAATGTLLDITDHKLMEDTLKDSEIRFRQLFDNAVEGFFQSTPHGTFIAVNHSFARMHGYASPAEMIATVTNIGTQLYVHDEDRTGVTSLMKLEDIVEDYELEFRRKDGALVWGSMNARTVRDNRGQISYYEGTLVDITSRKRAEEEFRRQYRFLQTLMDSIPVPIYYLDTEGICGGCNQEFGNFIAQTTNNVIGKPLSEIWQEDISASGRHLIRENENTQAYETVLTDADGVPRNVIVSKASFLNPDGSQGGEIGSFIDITDLKEAERILAISEEKYRNILQSIEDGYFETNLHGNFTFYNRALCTIFGYPGEELIGMDHRVLVDPENAKIVLRVFKEVFVTSVPKKGFFWEIIQKSGTRRDIDVSISLIVNQEGEPTGFRGIVRDITERREAERELEHYRHHLEELVRERTDGLEREIAEHRRTELALRWAKEAAETANIAKSAFLTNMSHEFRTPLNAVIGFSDVLNRQFFGPLNDKQAEYVQDIVTSGQHLLSLITDVLDLAKIEAGKMDLCYEPVSLPEFLEESLFMIKEKARTHGIEIRVEANEDLAGIAVKADVRQLKQVMYNLLSNAAKFTPDGGQIIITARAVEGTASGNNGGGSSIEVSVRDTGIGIALEDQEQIFEEFHQVNTAIKGKNPGTGLGLSLAHRIIDLHGGRIWVESAGLGKGSTFIFRIPCVPPQASK